MSDTPKDSLSFEDWWEAEKKKPHDRPIWSSGITAGNAAWDHFMGIIEEKNREIEFRDGTILGCEAVEAVLTRDNEEMTAFILRGYCPSADGFEGPQTFGDCGKCVYCKIKQGEEPWLKLKI